MKKRILTILLATAMLLSLLPITAFAGAPHAHKDATGADVSFEPINDLAGLKALFATGGNGYLTNDITADGTLTINTAAVNLCLNDKVLNLDKKGHIAVENGKSFALYDCGNTKRYYDKDADGLWTLKASGESDYFTVGGVITGGKAENGGGVHVNNGSFTMYGGNISGNAAIRSALNSNSICGGGVGVTQGTFTMHNGTVSGNRLSGSGFGAGVGALNGTVTMMNGTISHNSTDKNDGFGGGVGVRKGTFTMKSGTLSNNFATYGGGVLTYQKAFLTIENAKIIDNTTVKAGGGVNMRSGDNTIRNTTVSGNTSGTHGGGVYVTKEYETKTEPRGASTLLIENVTISNNTAAQFGGGLYASADSDVTVTDAAISGNTADTGGGIQVSKTAKVYLAAAAEKKVSITGNTAKTSGGGFTDLGELHLSGAVVVIDNTCDGKPSNLTLDSADKTVICDGLKLGSEIHITVNYTIEPGTTSAFASNTDFSQASYFRSDDKDLIVAVDTPHNTLVLMRLSHPTTTTTKATTTTTTTTTAATTATTAATTTTTTVAPKPTEPTEPTQPTSPKDGDSYAVLWIIPALIGIALAIAANKVRTTGNK